jgi:Zn-dependent metalloprotease
MVPVLGLLLVPALAGALGCSTGSRAPGQDTATVRVAITRAPADATCIQIRVEASRASTRSFDTRPGESSVFVIGGLPVGEAKFSAVAFAQACATLAPGATPTWDSEPVAATIVAGTANSVSIEMRPYAAGLVSVDFPGASPDGGGQPDGGGGAGDGGAAAATSPAPQPFALGEPAFPSVVSGEKARARLDSGRRAQLDEIEARTKRPVELTIDAQSGAVLVMDLHDPGTDPQATTEAKVRAFLGSYLRLLDPRIDLAELVASEETRMCAGRAAVFGRQVGGTTVLGSHLTVHLSAAGEIVQVVNGLAPAPGRILAEIPGGLSGRPLSALVPAGLDPSLTTRRPVLVPAADGSGLLEAELAAWSTPDRDYASAVVVGDVAMAGAGSLAVAGNARRGARAGEPRFHLDPRTDLPDYIDYRDIGGVGVNMLPGERNPVEVAYRFLDEHPALFRTGAARCQYLAKAIDENPGLPGARAVRLEQRHAGLPVFGAELVFTIEGWNQVMSIAGHVLPYVEVPLAPPLDAGEAIRRAEIALRATLDPDDIAGHARVTTALAGARTEPLVFPSVFVQGGQGAQLAWQVQMGEFQVFIDASSGQSLFSLSNRHGDNIINDGGGRHQLRRLEYGMVMRNGVAVGSAPLHADVLPMAGAQATVTATLASLGWGGIRRSGSDLVANVNVSIDGDCASLPNAFSDFLTGETFYCPGMAKDDVVGHEYTHGVIGNSSALIYRDESGAINEAYADLMGNLMFPDVAPGSWLVGEQTVAGVLRNMLNPGARGDPSHISMFQYRTPACTGWPTSCDAGGVHTNSGIVNRAHTVLTDGLSGVVRPIGRAKMLRLGFLTMTEHLTPWALMTDVALATRDACQLLLARRPPGLDADPFTQTDCDQVTLAFSQVGLDPGLSSGWSEGTGGLPSGRDILLAGETTTTGCAVTNVTATLNTLAGTVPADLDPATTALPPSAHFALFGIDFVVPPGTPPPPIGTTGMSHTIDWFSAYLRKPNYRTLAVLAPPPAGAPDCRTPVGLVPISRPSEVFYRARDLSTLFGARDTTRLGNNPSSMDGRCAVVDTLVEILSLDRTRVIAGPGRSADYVFELNILGYGIPFHQRAAITSQPALAGGDLSAPVSWSFDMGQDITFRLRYQIQKPFDVPDCVP